MKRVRRLKDGVQQKWDGLPDHYRVVVVVGLLICFFVSVNLLNGKLKATSSPPEPFIFRAIVEEREPKHLILKGRILGSKGKVCFAKEETEKGSCPVEFPVLAWGYFTVRAEITSPSPATGQIWLTSGEGVKSNQLEISF